jgi:high-affinity nickel-transport protein
MRHATDPDHVVAVTTIVSNQRSIKHAAAIGAVWGFGHTLTILLVGGGIIVFKWVIPPRVGLGMELAVAVMLIVLGIANLGGTLRWLSAQRTSLRDPVHSHAHSHGDYVHTHAHGHAPERHPHAEDATPLARLDARLGALPPYRLVRPLVVGVVHGLAGSAAVALLVLTAIRTPSASILYLLIFGIGTIAGMSLITAVVGIPFAYASPRLAGFQRQLRLTAGLISLGFGLVVAYQVGIVDGLLSGQVHWTAK